MATLRKIICRVPSWRSAHTMAVEISQFVSRGRKIVAAGLNYRSMIESRNVPEPAEPIIFLKPTSSYITAGQHIEIPAGFEVHHEIELGVIIGKKCRNVSEEYAKCVIAGYCLALDLTAVSELKIAREKGAPWTLGKGFDTACPVSPAIPAEKVPRPDCLQLWCSVNENMKQNSNTSDMFFSIEQLIAYITKYMTLEPYDVILTGSPVGPGKIESGDVIKGGLGDLVEIEFKVK